MILLLFNCEALESVCMKYAKGNLEQHRISFCASSNSRQPLHTKTSQYTEIFSRVKLENFIQKHVFNILGQNMYYGYTGEPPRQGGTNEYPQSMVWIKSY